MRLKLAEHWEYAGILDLCVAGMYRQKNRNCRSLKNESITCLYIGEGNWLSSIADNVDVSVRYNKTST